MKHLFFSIVLWILLFINNISAQQFTPFTENTPCTAICLDLTKSFVQGKMAEPDGITPNLHKPCGEGKETNEHNPIWFSFRPKNLAIHFRFTISNCEFGNKVQWTIWKGDDCNNITPINCTDISAVLAITTTPGAIYYLQIDGFAESQCNFRIDYNKAEFLSTAYTKTPINAKACTNSTIEYTSDIPKIPDIEYLWTVSPNNIATIEGNNNAKSVKIKYNNTLGKATITRKETYASPCDGFSNLQTYNIDVKEDTLLDFIKCNYQICEKQQPFYINIEKCFPYVTPDFSTYVVQNIKTGKDSIIFKTTYLDKQRGCKIQYALNIDVKAQKNSYKKTLPPILLCNNDSVKVKGRFFFCSDASQIPIKFTKPGSNLNCDTIFEVVVQCITPQAICTPRSSIFDCTKQANLLDLSNSKFTPQNISNQYFKGEGTKIYKFYYSSKDTFAQKILLTKPINVYGIASYKYKVIHDGLSTEKTCVSSIEVPFYVNNNVATNTFPRFKVEANPPCQKKVYTAKVIDPDPNSTYLWSYSPSLIPTASQKPNELTFVRTDENKITHVFLKRVACGLTSSQSAFFHLLPNTNGNIEIKGKNTACQGEITVYTAKVSSPFLSYNWAITNGKIISMVDSNTIFVLWDGSKSNGVVTLEGTNSCGTAAKMDYTVSIQPDCKKCVSSIGNWNTSFLLSANKTTKPIIIKNQPSNVTFGYDDVAAFVLHEGNTGKIINPISINKTGIFSFNDSTMKCNKVYYVSYLVSRNKNVLPDFADSCLSISSKSQSIAWLCKTKSPIIFQSKTEHHLSDVSVYPNPARDILNIEFPYVERNIRFSLFDIQGREVISKSIVENDSNYKFELPVETLIPGIYFIKIIVDGNFVVNKIRIE